ncbi:hypothetical protein WME90_00760 [Sorangium sp. So ce375]
MKLVAMITESSSIARLLTALGEPTASSSADLGQQDPIFLASA